MLNTTVLSAISNISKTKKAQIRIALKNNPIDQSKKNPHRHKSA
jgi:hypothetical protein